MTTRTVIASAAKQSHRKANDEIATLPAVARDDRPNGSTSGQLIVGALVIVLILAITLPALISYLQKESEWTIKHERTTKAYQLAEGAVERGYQRILQSSTTWSDVINGTIPSGYNFDTVYQDASGGQYAIRMRPLTSNSISIVGVGRDRSTSEIRAIQTVYSDGITAPGAISAQGVVGIGAAVDVEWGSVTSYTSVSTSGRNHPRYYSTGAITPQDANGAAPPNTDNVQWWSYKTDLPPQSSLDFTFYISSAQASPAPPAGCPAAYYNVANLEFKGCIDTTGRTYYTTGDVTFKAGSGGNFIRGNIIALGALTVSGNGGSANGVTDHARLPPYAWQEYGNDWSAYQPFDTGEPATYAQAVASNYVANTTYDLTGILVNGLLYSGGATGLNGGGNGRFHGAIMTAGSALMTTSNFTVYYDNGVAAAIRYTTVSISRTSWREISTCGWTGTNPTCP